MNAIGCKSWLWAVAIGAVVGLVAAVAFHFGQLFVRRNFDVVLVGRVYRSAQMSPEQLARCIRERGVRTVVNLRGNCNPHPWYLDECRVTHAAGVSQADVCFSAGRLPAVEEIRHLVRVLDRSEQPILLHCRQGADRTGLAAVVARLLYTDDSPDQALIHLGVRNGHFALGRPANIDRFFDLYEARLRSDGLGHTSDRFRHWLAVDYRPAECWARIDLLAMPDPVPADRPWRLRARVHNRSTFPWRFRPGNTAGFHLGYIITGPDHQGVANGRAGLFETELAPGGRIELDVVVPALEAGRYTLFLDMIDEGQCWFYQVGSEPLERAFVVE